MRCCGKAAVFGKGVGVGVVAFRTSPAAQQRYFFTMLHTNTNAFVSVRCVTGDYTRYVAKTMDFHWGLFEAETSEAIEQRSTDKQTCNSFSNHRQLKPSFQIQISQKMDAVVPQQDTNVVGGATVSLGPLTFQCITVCVCNVFFIANTWGENPMLHC